MSQFNFWFEIYNVLKGIKMGNTNESKSFLQKGEGLRILSIKLNCPFDGKVEPFFDFIIDVLPLEPQRSAK